MKMIWVELIGVFIAERGIGITQKKQGEEHEKAFGFLKSDRSGALRNDGRWRDADHGSGGY
jgi:hypothetical protein